MKRTESEIFSLLDRACSLIYDGAWYEIYGHTEDVLFCRDCTGDAVEIKISELAGKDVDMYEEVIITDRGA